MSDSRSMRSKSSRAAREALLASVAIIVMVDIIIIIIIIAMMGTMILSMYSPVLFSTQPVESTVCTNETSAPTSARYNP